MEIALSTKFPPALNKKSGKLWSTNNNVFWYANALEFKPRDFAASGMSTLTISPPPIGLTALGRLTLGFAPNFEFDLMLRLNGILLLDVGSGYH